MFKIVFNAKSASYAKNYKFLIQNYKTVSSADYTETFLYKNGEETLPFDIFENFCACFFPHTYFSEKPHTRFFTTLLGWELSPPVLLIPEMLKPKSDWSRAPAPSLS